MVRTEKDSSGRYRYIHTLTCKVCSNSYERIASNRTPLRDAYCSKECRQEWFKFNRRAANCTYCSKQFYQVNKEKKFCNRKCYSADIKENPDKYNLIEKAKHARTFSNTPETIEKGLQKKLDEGLIIDWTDASWKQFWRRCNELTRKRRLELVEDWDGYDYIDGEYIKPYLDLHYSHKNYPTLDHIIPRSEFYKQGKSPQEACQPENLKWTKRTNNSKKYNKT